MSPYFSSVFTVEKLSRSRLCCWQKIMQCLLIVLLLKLRNCWKIWIFINLLGMTASWNNALNYSHLRWLYSWKHHLLGQLPLIWKTAHITPVHKKRNKSHRENYRQISLTCIVCKIAETVVKTSRGWRKCMSWEQRICYDQYYCYTLFC